MCHIITEYHITSLSVKSTCLLSIVTRPRESTVKITEKKKMKN